MPFATVQPALGSLAHLKPAELLRAALAEGLTRDDLRVASLSASTAATGCDIVAARMEAQGSRSLADWSRGHAEGHRARAARYAAASRATL